MLTGEKTTGQFSTADGVQLPAKLTWKLVSRRIENHAYLEKHDRLVKIEESLAVLNANKLTVIKNEIHALNEQWRQLLINPETEEIKAELRTVPPTIEGVPIEELTVTLPK